MRPINSLAGCVIIAFATSMISSTLIGIAAMPPSVKGDPCPSKAFPGKQPAAFLWLAELSLPRATLAKGAFLVSSRQLTDPNFSKTVVLIINYDQEGAMGVVINRPSNVKLSTVLPEIEELKEDTYMIYLGGPVARSQMMLLIGSDRPPAGSPHVFEDVYVSSSWSILEQMLDQRHGEERFRVYAGYAGWAPGQLENEVSRGDWYVLPGDSEMIFDMSASEVWPKLIRRSSGLWVKGDPNQG